MRANDPRGGAIFKPRGMVGRIYKEDFCTLLHRKYESSGHCGLSEYDFLCSFLFFVCVCFFFFHYKSLRVNLLS